MAERELICIVCPAGCFLKVQFSAKDIQDSGSIKISGNKCKLGIAYAKEELFSPKRVVTATCAASLNSRRRIPVRTSAPCPKENIQELLADIYNLKQALPVKTGQKLISNWKHSGIDVIATRTLD